ncbi:EAL domain-containing protein [Oceanicaulis sp. AH-315-P02]|nr:EAL domain-containing protein [Robiginitomaculum sp.]MBL1431560.1 EAL domain-containing protein [Robiginitomaculum sp.]MBN4047917.1 EAL domain-containing protein [Oceanicaulis sp. AH-315-P02]
MVCELLWFISGVVTVLFDKFQKSLVFKATALFSIAVFFVAIFMVIIGSVSDLAHAKSLIATETTLNEVTRLSIPSFGFFITKNLWKGAVILGLGIPLSILVVGRLLAPIKELIRVAKCAANGDLTARVAFSRKDEFGTLANSINLMLERMKANIDRTRWLAYGDSLTRLANKTAFTERLRLLVDGGKAPGALFLIDLDGFKRLNDAYGQEEGDALLCATADRLRQVTGKYINKLSANGSVPNPVLARLSGDEFALIAPGCVSVPMAQQIAKEIVETIAQPLSAAGQPVTLSARIGIAMYPHDASDSKTLLNSVNFAIDVAKENGGGNWQFFEPSMTQAAIRRITLQNEMRRAIKNREFIVFYQPKIDVRDGSISGCEALVRWQKAPGKIISPGAFIDVAEETGLILEIGDYVLEEACRAAARWLDAGFRCPVAVNVSALQFARDDFTQIVGKILEDTGLPHELLELELTESVAMTNPERLIEQVSPLRDRGVRFAIDDFGTGHSSLAYLTRLPFDVFKIDQSFVQEMTEDKHARVIVQTVLAMAESLGYRTVAEGVETREHFAFLQLHCCDYVQGYYFSRPVPEADFTILLEQDRKGLDRKAESDQLMNLSQAS